MIPHLETITSMQNNYLKMFLAYHDTKQHSLLRSSVAERQIVSR